MNKFFIIATLCSFVLLAIVLSIGFNSFGNMSNGNASQNSSTIVRYANKAMATVKSVASPVLEKIGVNVNSIHANPTDALKQELQKAGAAINEATKNLTQ